MNMFLVAAVSNDEDNEAPPDAAAPVLPDLSSDEDEGVVDADGNRKEMLE